jgi:proteic killer suppression protein
MIKSFRHRGLEKFFTTGKKATIDPRMVKKLQLILAQLKVSTTPGDMDLPGLRLHKMKEGSTYASFWAVDVTGNWRVLFRFAGADVIDVDLIDYH